MLQPSVKVFDQILVFGAYNPLPNQCLLGEILVFVERGAPYQQLMEWLNSQTTPSGIFLALNEFPPAAYLNLLKSNHINIGVYRPNEAPTFFSERFNRSIDNVLQAETLRRLRTVWSSAFVISEKKAVEDSLHYAEMVSRYATQWIEI